MSGNGRNLTKGPRRAFLDTGWDNIVTQLIDSATSTTLIHDALADLAPPGTYFRFSPTIGENDAIDETDHAVLGDFKEAASAMFAGPAAMESVRGLRHALGIV